VAWAVSVGIVSHGGLLPATRQDSGREAREIPGETNTIMCENSEISAHIPQDLLANDGPAGRVSDGSRQPTDGQRSRHRGRPTVMTASRLAQAKELPGSHTITDIATKLGVSRRTVYAHMWQIRPDAPDSLGGIPTRTAGR
jgi:hypothetical protein